MGQLTASLYGSTGGDEATASTTSGSRFPFPKIQLHCHLEGCVRHQTILELANSKKIDLRGAKTVADVKKLLVTTRPSSLAAVLAAFDIFLPVFIGDLIAIERIAYEMCEDMARNGVVYFEGRFSPNLLTTQSVRLALGRRAGCVERFQRGERDFDIKARSILCCIRAHDVWNRGIVELALKHKEHGVVAIDAAGCSHGSDEEYEPSVVAAFLRAQELGIHRTVHAGESAGAQSVVRGVEEMKAERIGHGYHLMDDEAAYEKYAKDMRIHLEACPLSAMMTGAVDEDWTHPVRKWAHDGVNFSLSTDDPTCFDNSIESELSLSVDKIGLTVPQLWQCQLNAAHSCFLPDDEKTALVERIRAAQPEAE
ncbi:hypothetical protein M3Y99_00999500 [Aphelenchoides fujianensis]|nr:hypothetical protein M3Y99_00999500 [Aphelenchoides fujianensis]